MRTIIALLLLGLTYNIKTVNAAAPTFDTPPMGGGTGSIAENHTPNTVIITLQATDGDGDSPTFTVSSQTPATPTFSVNGNDELIVTSALDFETTPSFTLTLSVTDGTTPVTNTYTLTITDIDDESPVFSRTTYTATISDSASAGTTVTTVTATDADSGSFTYSIQGAQTTFAISAAGVITVTDPSGLSSLGASVTLNIQATDGTNPAGTAAVTVTIQGSLCNSSPCQNGGTCTATGTSTYTCACLSGYTGTNCETVDRCTSDPCQNDATCMSETADYTCMCNKCAEGKNCTENEKGGCLLKGECNAAKKQCDCTCFNIGRCELDIIILIVLPVVVALILFVRLIAFIVKRYNLWRKIQEEEIGYLSFLRWCKEGPICRHLNKSGANIDVENTTTNTTSEKPKYDKGNSSGTNKDHENQKTETTPDKLKEGKENGSSDNRPSNASTEAQQKKHDNQPDQLEMVESHKSTDM